MFFNSLYLCLHLLHKTFPIKTLLYYPQTMNDASVVLAMHGHGYHPSASELTVSPTHRQQWMWTGNLLFHVESSQRGAVRDAVGRSVEAADEAYIMCPNPSEHRSKWSEVVRPRWSTKGCCYWTSERAAFLPIPFWMTVGCVSFPTMQLCQRETPFHPNVTLHITIKEPEPFQVTASVHRVVDRDLLISWF